MQMITMSESHHFLKDFGFVGTDLQHRQHNHDKQTQQLQHFTQRTPFFISYFCTFSIFYGILQEFIIKATGVSHICILTTFGLILR